MKIGFIGDSHIEEMQPENRTDNYYVNLLAKLSFVCSVCQENGINILVIPGDIFNKPVVNTGVIGDIYKILVKYNIKLKVVIGQHDLTFRYLNNRTSPVIFLNTLKLVEVLTKEGKYLNDTTYITGLSYGETEEHPTINKSCETNILVIHRFIGPKAPNPGGSFLTAKQAVLKYGEFDLIICGDYHYAYAKQFRNSMVVNAGILCRKSIADRDHHPAMFIFDCSEKTLKRIEIPHKPAKEIFDFSAKMKVMEKSLVESVLSGGAQLADEIKKVSINHSLTFRERLVRKCEIERIGDHVTRIFDDIYNDLGGEDDPVS